MSTSKSKQEWLENKLRPATKKSPEREEQFLTTSGIEIDDIYAPDDRQGSDYNVALGYPGEFPFTRGVQPTMYRGRMWTMRQYSGFASAEATNKRYHYLLEQGQTGLSVAFDLPTQIGYDSDSPNAQGEVGKVGVPISSLEDMEALFDGIPLGKVSTSMTINAPAIIVLAMYVAVAESQGVTPDKLGGTLPPAGSTSAYDFDDGVTPDPSTDALAGILGPAYTHTGFGSDEVDSAPGDSGGPTFLAANDSALSLSPGASLGTFLVNAVPAQSLTVTRTGGEAEEISGVLPLHHAMVVRGKDLRFSLTAGAQGFVIVSGLRCAYP